MKRGNIASQLAEPAPDSRQAAGQLWKDPDVQKKLRTIVSNLEPDSSLRPDLYQEGLVRLWRAERESPGQTNSWYLQRCAFHLMDLKKKGRSIDTGKRRSNQMDVLVSAADEGSSNNRDAQDPSAGIDIMSEICANDLINVLSERMDSTDKAILDLLLEGYEMRSIARELGVSHVTVIGRRRRLARLVRKLAKPERSSNEN